MEEKSLNKEMKALLLSVLKKGSINQNDVNQISKLSGIEVQNIQVEIIDRRDQVETN